ncbi:MAG: hypothetical protein JXB62_20020 [Pirellulales bacterium]|nr:hypothetical protein [Pirellulales bacterium]
MRRKSRQPVLPPAPPLARGLVGAWLFCEGCGATVRDYSGRGRHGALVNMDPAGDWAVTRYGPALDFDGDGDRIDLDGPVVLPDDTPWTIAFRVYLDSFSTYDGFFGHDYVPTKYSRCVGQAGDGWVTLANDANEITVWSVAGYATGQWIELMITADGKDAGNLELWINGVSQGTKTRPDSSLTIRRLATYSPSGGDRGFDGRMDYFCIWRGVKLRPVDRRDPLAMFRPRRPAIRVGPAAPGPYGVAAAGVWHPGAAAGQLFTTGQTAGEIHG